ncbi:MAG: hypothetical protein HKO66_07695 [Saprospiraceae bacterium]|nr:hypothetical protein [Bacteroidia bacterium]NNE14359.1 hypothetical protein [Saprospiraceae bacterium]NNL92098.1 hypothetical protein [Saprospiraceae bacterium]
MTRILPIVCFFILSSSLSGQRVITPKLVELDWKGIIYKKEWAIDLRLHENGAAIAYNSGKIKSYDRTNYYQIELGFTKDPRERNQSKISTRGRSGSFSYGKINSLINVRLGAGVKKYLSEKEKRKGLAVGYTYELGPSIALLKPYYLDLIYTTEVDGQLASYTQAEPYNETTAERFLDVNTIDDKASFFKGFDEISLRAGIQGKIGAHLAWGAFDKYVKAFETGIMFDLFASKVPILIETEEISNNRYFLRLYLNFHLGVRNN